MPLMAAELGLDTKAKGSLLSAFPLGYLLTQVLGGYASDKIGGKLVMALALFSTGFGIMAFGTLKTAEQMWVMMFAMGLLQGPSFPTNGVIVSKWVPKTERSFATAVSDSGGPVGALVALFGTPILADALGWRAALMVCGGVTVGFSCLWLWLAASSPATCSYVTKEEVAELEKLGVGSKSTNEPPPKTPWGILAVPSAYSVILAHSAFNYNRYLMYNWVVTFYTDALGMSVADAGKCMLWPNLVDAVSSLAVGRLADVISNSGLLSTVWTRRLFSSIGFIGTGVGAGMLGNVSTPSEAMLLVTFASGIQAFHNAGFKSSYADLSQKYTGVLSGIGNMCASGASFLVPLVAAGMLENNGGSKEKAAWSVVFSSVFYCGVAGALAYSFLVSAESIDPKIDGSGADSKTKKKQ